MVRKYIKKRPNPLVYAPLPEPERDVALPLARGDEVHDPDGSVIRAKRAGRRAKKPIRLVHRQVEAIHDADYRLMYRPTTRRRYSQWAQAWKGMLDHVFRYPHWEFWLEEDLIREPELGRRRRGEPDPGGWSQVCRKCDRWGVRRLAPWQARCIHCGGEGTWMAAPTTTEPRCSWRQYENALTLRLPHLPPLETPVRRQAPEHKRLPDEVDHRPPRERAPGTDPGTHGAQARMAGRIQADE